MAEYKRKKMHRSEKRAPKTMKNTSPVKEKRKKPQKRRAEKEPNVRVIEGRKFHQRRNFRIFVTVVAVILLVITILHFVLPIGITEVLGNRIAAIGTGHYPREIYGTETLNSVSKGYYYYVLTNQELDAFSTGGKKIVSFTHGFAHPILACSETRALIYDQGGTAFSVYNLRGRITAKTTGEAIQTATIGRDGSYAIATESNSYASVVSVYNRKNKKMYEWYSAKGIVNNIALSPDGKKIAVSTLNADSGELNSRVLVLKFNSADAVETFDYGDAVICGLINNGRSFAVLTAHSCSHIRWNNYSRSDFNSGEELYLARKAEDGLLLVYNRSGNRQENTVVLFSEKGKKISEFSFKGLINDMAYDHNRFYCISETNLYLLSTSGKEICHETCEFGARRLAILGGESMAIITNSQIRMVDLNE